MKSRKPPRMPRQDFRKIISNPQAHGIEDIVSALDKAVQERLPSITSAQQARLSEKLESLSAKIHSVEKQVKSRSPSHDRPLLRRIASLETRPLRKRIEVLEKSNAALRKELLKMIPTKKLSELESMLSPPKAPPIKPLLDSMEKSRLQREQQLLERVSSLEASIQKSREFTLERSEALRSELVQTIDKKVSDLTEMISRGDFTVNKKLNSQFLLWLGNLENQAKEMVGKNLESIQELAGQVSLIKKDFAKSKDLEELEDSLLAPIAELDTRLKRLVRKEIADVRTGLKKAAEAERIDSKTLQKEIHRIVAELEKQRTDTLEQEIEALLEQGEKLKKNKVKI